MTERSGCAAAGTNGAEGAAGKTEAGAREAVVEVESGGDAGDGSYTVEERDAREIHRLLSAALERLQRHPFGQSDDAATPVSALVSADKLDRSTSKYAVSPGDTNADANAATSDADSIAPNTSSPPDFAFTDLIYQLRDAHRASVYANRCSDDEGPRRVFGFLVSPGSHEVTLQTHEVDIVFHDELSPAERCGIIRCTNTFNAIFAVHNLTIGILIRLIVYPICVLVIAGLFAPEDAAAVSAMQWMWVLQHSLQAAWMISYIVSYAHIGGMMATVRANPVVTTYTLLASLIYTSSSIAFRPDAWNVPAVVHRFIFDIHKMMFGGTIVFFKLRDRREDFDKFFAPKKGCFGILWVMGDVILWLVDVGRHIAILYAAQVASEAAWDQEHGGMVSNGTVVASAATSPTDTPCRFIREEVALAELTAAGRAFHVTLRQVMNASFTCSVLFGATTLLESFRGSIGSAFPNLQKRTIVNTR